MEIRHIKEAGCSQLIMEFRHISEAGGKVTAPWPESGDGSAATPRIQAPRSQQNDSTLLRARMYIVVTPPGKIIIPMGLFKLHIAIRI